MNESTRPEPGPEETCNPWTVVNVVFRYLADEGLHPTLGGSGNPGEPAAALLRALGITPVNEGDTRVRATARRELAELRRVMLDEPPA